MVVASATTVTTVDVGDVVALAIAVTDSAGVAANATTVVLTITLPDGTTVAPTVTNATTGSYTATYTPAQVGRHQVAWVATGTNAGAYRDVFNVADSANLPVVSLSEMKARLNISGSSSDEELRGMLDTATRAGELRTGRVFGRRAVTSEIHHGGRATIVLRQVPVVSVTSVTEDGTSVAAAGYELDMPSGLLTRMSGTYSAALWSAGVGNVAATYVAGYGAQPPTDVRGVMEMCAHLWRTQRGRFSRGDDDDWNPGMGYSIPRRVAELWDLDRIPGIG